MDTNYDNNIFISNNYDILFKSLMEVPVGIAILKGRTHVYEFVNSEYLKIVDREIVIGKTVKENIPESATSGIIQILDGVYTTGITFTSSEFITELFSIATEKLEIGYYNVTIQPIRNDMGEIDGLLCHGVDVTKQVLTRKKTEDSEKRITNILSHSTMAIAILKGSEMTVAFANSNIIDIWGKGKDVVGQTFFDLLPELKGQGFNTLLQQVYNTGIPYYGYESKAILFRNGKFETFYYNFVYEPYTELDNSISGITMLATDVTESVLAKKQIEISEAFNRTILESSPDCIIVLDKLGRIQFMNLNGIRQLEINDFASIHNSFYQKFWGRENEFIAKKSLRKALLGETAQFEMCVKSTNGTIKWWDVKMSPVGHIGDVVNQIISVSRDVTEKKILQDVITKTVTHLKLATESANVGTWSYDLNTQKLEWNILHKKMWGYDESLDNLRYEDWHKLILPNEKMQTFAKIDEARSHKTLYDAEYTIKNATTNTLHTIRSVGKFLYNGVDEAYFLSGISIDITKQRAAEKKLLESEKQFRMFADSIQNLAWIADSNGLIYWHNQQWYDFTGTTLEQTKGWGWIQVLHPDHVEKVVDFVKKALIKKESFELTFPLKKYNGEYRWFLARAYPIKDEFENIERWIGTKTDITEQKSFTEALENKVIERTEELAVRTKQLENINQTLDFKNMELANANEELRSFSFMASHDLQEPLRKIQMFSKRILQTETFSEQTQNYFDRIIATTERMQNLIVALLDFSSTNTTQLKKVSCDLNEIIEESRSDLSLMITDKNASFEFQHLPIIKGERFQLSQLFTNLIGNAIKYSQPDSTPHIKITAELVHGKNITNFAANKQQQYHLLKIIDNGIGFEQEFSNIIFEPFQRLHGKTEFSGTGIGLAIVKKIVSNHSGFITAEGKIRQGSTFSIYLPVK